MVDQHISHLGLYIGVYIEYLWYLHTLDANGDGAI